MRTLLLCLAGALALPAIAADLPPQDTSATYRFDIAMRESDAARKVAQRKYTMLGGVGEWAKIQAGPKVPYSTGAATNYADLGSVLECRARGSSATTASVECNVESDAIAATQASRPALNPVINSRKLRASGSLPLDQEILIGSMDDPATGRQLDVYVTVRRL